MQLGETAPSFELLDTEGTAHSVPSGPFPATVVVVTCNHCPYVIAWNPRLRAVAEEYAPRGVRFLAINGNDPERYPADAPDRMVAFVRETGWPIPYLHDRSQNVLRALGAERTPEVFVFDGELRLAYHGAPDDDHEDPAQDARHLRDALDAVLTGRRVATPETPPRGCSIKWIG